MACVRLALCILIAGLATACGSAEPGAGSARNGISLDVPDGVSAEVTRGTIRIATSDLSVVLYEYEPQSRGEATYFDAGWPVRLEAADFRHRRPGTASDEDARLVSVAGRFFSVFTEGIPVGRELEELNQTLATIRGEPGDYFPGSVEPTRFASRSGWYVGDGGPAERRPYGEHVTSWAATIPYRDDEDGWTPRRTVEALPRDGIVMQTTLMRDRLWKQNALLRAPPYRIREFVRRGCPGKACKVPEYLLVAAYGARYRVEIRVYFGRLDPTDSMLAEADAMLAGLEFPDWGPWELENA